MSSKLARLVLKYFYCANILSGFVIIKCDFREHSVTKSYLRMFYCVLVNIYFAINYCYANAESAWGANNRNENEAVSGTIDAEIFVTYVAVLLITAIQIATVNQSIEFITKLMRLSESDDFVFEPLDGVGRQIAIAAISGEAFVVYLYLKNLHWMHQNGKQVSWNPFDNVLLINYLVNVPILIVARFSIFIAFCIDLMSKFVKILNRKIDETLTSFDDSHLLVERIQVIHQLLGRILRLLKSFERAYGTTIVVLQCITMFVAINQVQTVAVCWQFY